MKDYKKMLQAAYEENLHDECPPDSKLEFIGSDIFDFTTYHGAVDALFAGKMIEVLEAILLKKTFEYQDVSEENYLNYLLMCNMPFLKDKLEWGTSIRGAWFDEYGSHGKDECYELYNTMVVPKKEIKHFIKELIEWSRT